MATQKAIDLYWTVDGPFFTKDIKKTVRGNISDMLDKAAVLMEDQAKGDIASHAGSMERYTGWTWARTKGYTVSQKGKHWALWAAVATVTTGMDAKDAKRTKAAAATIERRWHPWRNAQRAARKAIKDLDFTKGLT